MMAKDYIRTKNYITKFIEMKTHLNAVSLKIQVRFICEFPRNCHFFHFLDLIVDGEITPSDGRCNERSHNSFDEDE